MDVLSCLKNKENVFYGVGCAEQRIIDYEKEMNVSFATDYREYLKNVGLVSYDGHELTGIGNIQRLDVKKVTLEMRKLHNVSEEYYVVEETNIDGIVIWQSSEGKIYSSRLGEMPHEICENLKEYIKNY